MVSEPDDLPVASHRATLTFIQTAAETAGYTTSLADPGGDEPTLIVLFDADEEQRQRSLRMTFVPAAGELDATELIQLFSPLPFAASPAMLADIRQAVAIVNEYCGLGGFGVQTDGTPYFRYTLAVARHPSIDDAMITEVIQFVEFHQEHFGDFLEGVADGAIAIEVLDAVIAAAG
jgi:hypothetical protein